MVSQRGQETRWAKKSLLWSKTIFDYTAGADQVEKDGAKKKPWDDKTFPMLLKFLRCLFLHCEVG